MRYNCIALGIQGSVVTQWKGKPKNERIYICIADVPGWMWELDCEESWAPKNWCFWTAVLEKTLESPLDCKEIQLVHPKGNHSWLFIGRTDAEAEVPMIGHLMQRTDSLEKTLMLRKIESGKRREWQRMRLLDGITYSMDVSLSMLWDLVIDKETCCAAVHRVVKNWTQVRD